VVCAEPNIDRLPAEIRPLIGRCLAKHPQDRPTAVQLLAELSTAQPGARPLPEPAIVGLPGHDPAGPAPDEAARAMAPSRPAKERAAPPNLRQGPAPLPAASPEPTATVPPVIPSGKAKQLVQHGARRPRHPSDYACPPGHCPGSTGSVGKRAGSRAMRSAGPWRS
jgi:hypothetical protein